MACWPRLTPSRVRNLSNQLKICCSQVCGPYPANRIASLAKDLVFDSPDWVVHGRQLEFLSNVRFYAAPVKVQSKQEEDLSGPRLNEQISAEFVRLVTDQGHSVISRHEALQRARQLKLDLVEVQRNAKPPVCKLMDYHKEKYKQEVKEKDRAKTKTDVTLRAGSFKEVRFAAKIEQKDLQMKADMVKRLMERGYRVKCMATGVESQDLKGLLSRFSPLIEDVAIVESGPTVEKKQAYVIVRHSKFGPSKKGSKKKIPCVEASSPAIESSVQNPFQSGENLDSEFGLETKSGIVSDDTSIVNPVELATKDSKKIGSSWSVLETQEYEKCFDIPSNEHRVTDKSSPQSVVAPKAENGYRTEQINRSTRPMDTGRPAIRDSRSAGQQSVNHGRPPHFNPNVGSPTRETRRNETDASTFGDPKFTSEALSKQENLHPVYPSSPPSFGIFSTNQTTDELGGGSSRPEGGNRYKKPSNLGPARNPPSAVNQNSYDNRNRYAGKVGR